MEISYRGHKIRRTNTNTEVVRRVGAYRTYKAIVPLYEIVDLKPAGKHPFLTSIDACREYIREHLPEKKEAGA